MVSTESSLDSQSKQALVDSVPFWWHSIDLGNGIITPGHNHDFAQRAIVRTLPQNLQGKSIIDIGCWDGKYSFEAESRGAAEVLAIDNQQQEEFVKSKYGLAIDSTQGIRIAKKILGSNIFFESSDLKDFRHSRDKFDVSFLLGVLYHQQDPWDTLQTLKRITRETAIIESQILPFPGKKPRQRYYADDELNKDPTNWYVPNIPKLLDWVQDSGFRQAKLIGTYALRTRAIVQAWV